MAKRSRKKTRADLRKHALRRLAVRYGEYIETEEYEKLCGLCHASISPVLLVESNNVIHYLLKGYLIAVYNKKLKAIATFLPDTAVWNYL